MPRQKTEIRADLHSSTELRALSRTETSPWASKRMLALANALDGMSFTESARVVGMERQALGDAAKRYNAEGLKGLYDRQRTGRRRKLDAGQEQKLAQIVLAGPDPEVDGISAYTLDDLCAICEQTFAVTYRSSGMSVLIKRLGFSRQKARPHHPEKDEAAQAAFKGAF